MRGKNYIRVERMEFFLEGMERQGCLGCGRRICKQDPCFLIFHEEGSEILCWRCASLLKMKETMEIRESEFDSRMANIHRKNWKKTSAGRTSREILEMLFPEFPKIRLVAEELEE